jgi:FkbM family methyltransferase
MIKILSLIFWHPLNKGKRFDSLIRFAKWQVISRFYRYPILLPFTSKSSYLCWNGLKGLTGNFYCGLMEFEDMAFARHLLTSEDVFFDIGANVGSYSILVGVEAQSSVYSFEPHPETFSFLHRNIGVNKIKNIQLFNIALGSKNDQIFLTANLDSANHVSLDSTSDSVKVELKVLDELNLPIPTLIKLDVEGFELEVLRGASKVLQSNALKAIIIELNGSGKKFGFEDEEIHELLKNHGFIPYLYDPFGRKLHKTENFGNHNTIYIRDLEFVNSRVAVAPTMILSNGSII